MGPSDRRIANTRDGKPVWSDPVAAAEKEHPLHVDHCSKPAAGGDALNVCRL